MPTLTLTHASGETSSVEVYAGTTLTVTTALTGFRGELVSHDTRAFSLEGVKSIALSKPVGTLPVPDETGPEPANVADAVIEPPVEAPEQAHTARTRKAK